LTWQQVAQSGMKITSIFRNFKQGIKVQDGFALPPESVGLGIDWDWSMLNGDQL
jgi:L-alanine-DL-glutamate epimerase-like enolase superfamily enzyme